MRLNFFWVLLDSLVLATIESGENKSIVADGIISNKNKQILSIIRLRPSVVSVYTNQDGELFACAELVVLPQNDISSI